MQMEPNTINLVSHCINFATPTSINEDPKILLYHSQNFITVLSISYQTFRNVYQYYSGDLNFLISTNMEIKQEKPERNSVSNTSAEIYRSEVRIYMNDQYGF